MLVPVGKTFNNITFFYPVIHYRDSSQFQLGVNGYSYGVNNNGYVLFHPDLRPVVRIIYVHSYDFMGTFLADN